MSRELAADEQARRLPHHRHHQPCVATAAGAVCRLTDVAMIGPIGVSQRRGAELATNGGSLPLYTYFHDSWASDFSF